MDNERDADGRILCPVCRKVILDPEGSPVVGTQRVHSQCWASPFRARITLPTSSAGDRG
jgi:hypothetical protein